jgi:hypothetical protein
MAAAGKRLIFTAEKPQRIRSALSVVLAGVESESDATCSARERLREFTRGGCDRFILDLRGVDVPAGEIFPAVRNVRAVHLGGVLVVTGEVTDAEVFWQIERLRHRQVSVKRLRSNFRAFVHALF